MQLLAAKDGKSKRIGAILKFKLAVGKVTMNRVPRFISFANIAFRFLPPLLDHILNNLDKFGLEVGISESFNVLRLPKSTNGPTASTKDFSQGAK